MKLNLKIDQERSFACGATVVGIIEGSDDGRPYVQVICQRGPFSRTRYYALGDAENEKS